MLPDYILQNETIILPGLSRKGKMMVILKRLSPFVVSYAAVYFFDLFPAAFIIITLFLYYAFRSFIFKPVVFSRIVLNKHAEGLLVNNKLMYFEEMLFLSLRERDDYAVIRLEGKRLSMLQANEKVLKTDCLSFEHAVDLCLMLREYINPALRINHIKVGFGIGAYESSGEGSRNESVEVWEYF